MDKANKQPMGRRERKRQFQLDHLADTAWRLFEAEGYDLVSMEHIAAVADVAKGTLYKHFPAKEALLRHRFHRELREGQAELLQAASPVPAGRARLSSFLAASADWSEGRRPYLLPYVKYRLAESNHPSHEEQRSGMGRVFEQLIGEGQSAGNIRSDIDAGVLAVYLEFLYLAALLRWLTGATPDLRAELSRMLDVFLGGIEVRP